MKRLYARFVLWVIRPALDRADAIESARIQANLTNILPTLKQQVESAVRARQ
ncbi:hypothetical protein PAQ31011_00817 [Pandoraea aquatica]|uniref:Uncharacterized protein n=1 Tax=Pandoraea aquatica TaxID=2508290 RepID=A0A5E4SI31_9BURK|nr:hypothetical protein [Pandoraea aquatica]VVD74935.1 hypothetical protein PAQ31011_00817 [Pandoraea aquatica]